MDRAVPVLEAHDVIEDGVDGGTEVVEEARHMEQVPESRRALKTLLSFHHEGMSS